MADYTLRSNGRLQPVAFEDRAEPVQAAIAAQTFDAAGDNYTDFKGGGPDRRKKGLARSMTRLGSM